MNGPIRGFAAGPVAPRSAMQIADDLAQFWALQLPEQRRVLTEAMNVCRVYQGEIAGRDREIARLREQLAAALAAAHRASPPPGGSLE